MLSLDIPPTLKCLLIIDMPQCGSKLNLEYVIRRKHELEICLWSNSYFTKGTVYVFCGGGGKANTSNSCKMLQCDCALKAADE